MSRLTGSEVRSMMEAYDAVYAPQITEQQIQEDFENWVDSLVEEGEDLSEYTWDEMYEVYNYINEQSAAGEMPDIGNAALAGMVGLAGAAGAAGAKAINAAQTLMSRRKSQSKPVQGQTTNLPSPAKPTKRETDIAKGQAAATAANQNREANAAKLPVGQKPRIRVTASRPAGSTTTTPGAASPKSPEPAPKPAPKPKPEPAPKTSQPAASIGLRQGAKQLGGATANVARSGPGKTALKYGIGVPAVVGGGSLAAVDIKRNLSGQSSASQRLGGALTGGAGDVIKKAGSIGASVPGLKDTGTPGETQQLGQYVKNIGSGIQKGVDVKLSKERGQQPAAPTPTDQNKKTKLPVYNSYLFDLNNNEYINEAQVLGKKGKKWISVTTDASGKKTETEVAPTPQAIQRYNSLVAQKSKPTAPAQSSKAPSGSNKEISSSEIDPTIPRAQARAMTQSQYNASMPKRQSSTGSHPVAPTAAGKLPVAQPKPAATKATPAPAPVPFGKTMPAPASASLDKLKINKDWAAANPRLAQAEVKKAEQRAAGKSTFSPEFRKTTTNPILYKPGALKQEATMNREPYDLVLEYLFSQGHVDTVDEANYVMLQMDAEMIGTIVEGLRDLLDPSKGVAARAQNQSPFAQPTQPSKSLPTTSSPFQKPGRGPGNAENRASSGDGGKLTTYGAGGGKAAEAGGKSYDQVVKQGAANLENKKRVQPKNQGPDFGR